MNQESIKMPQDLPSQKEEQWKNIISIIFLIVLPFIGLILMWLLASWSKKTKAIITFVIILVFVIVIAIFIGSAGVAIDQTGDLLEETRDITRKHDMRTISDAQQLYRMHNNQYYSSINYPLVILSDFDMPFDMPLDPATENSYGWIDNTRNPQKFCAYATLEEAGWFTASHRGLNECADIKPTLNDCCFP